VAFAGAFVHAAQLVAVPPADHVAPVHIGHVKPLTECPAFALTLVIGLVHDAGDGVQVVSVAL
jgi:hypothetical protein